MRRREFVIMFGVGVTARPLAARAQRSAMPVIGFLHAGSREENTKRLAAFLKGLGDGGFVDGHNVTIDYRWAAGRNDALPALAAELVRRKVAMIVTPASTAAARVAEQATTIPIVFAIGADPVELGLAQSLSRPGGNATGITSLNAEVGAKRLGLLRELAPQSERYFALANPTSPLA
jgi:putative ABC transport system substrate-binding protein